MRKPTLAEAVAYALLGGVMVFALLRALRHSHDLFDDAHITFRCADNLAHGRGLVYNPGERVEASSALLFAVVLAIPMAFGADALHAAQVLGTLGMLATVGFSFATVALVFPDWRGKLLALGAAYVVASATPITAYAMNGMETDVFVGLLTAGLYYYGRALARGGEPRVWPWVLGLASATRAEGFGFFIALLGVDVLRVVLGRDGSLTALSTLWRAVSRFGVVALPIELFRLVYYHALLPNPVVAKDAFASSVMSAPWRQALSMIAASDGAKILADYAKEAVGPFFGLMLLAPFVRRGGWLFLALATLAAAAAGVCLFGQGDWMPHHRLLAPLVPMLAVALALGLRLPFVVGPRRRATTALALALGVGAFWSLAGRLDEDAEVRPKMSYDAGERHLIDLGERLHAIGRPEDLLATDIAGIIPYYAKMRTLDMFGLADRHVATLGEHGGKMGKRDDAYVIAKHPSFYLLNFTSAMRELSEEAAFQSEQRAYWMVRTPFDRDARQPSRDKKVLLVRKDRPGMDRLVEALGAELVELDKGLGVRR